MPGEELKDALIKASGNELTEEKAVVIGDISNLSDIKASYFVENGMILPAIIIWELLAYSVFALVFMLIQDGLHGPRWKKGLVYGLYAADRYSGENGNRAGSILWEHHLWIKLDFKSNIYVHNNRIHL